MRQASVIVEAGTLPGSPFRQSEVTFVKQMSVLHFLKANTSGGQVEVLSQSLLSERQITEWGNLLTAGSRDTRLL